MRHCGNDIRFSTTRHTVKLGSILTENFDKGIQFEQQNSRVILKWKQVDFSTCTLFFIFKLWSQITIPDSSIDNSCFCVQVNSLSASFNSLCPSDAVWRQRSLSIFAHTIICFHYLNRCWLLINVVLWHSPESKFPISEQATIRFNEVEN